MIKWDDYFMSFAHLASVKSKDSTNVGAVLVGEENEIRLTAYNGPPRGVQDTPDRFERPRKYMFASHAEANLIAFAAREGIRTKECSVYVTHFPCSACTRTLIQAGIAEVVYDTGIAKMANEEDFNASMEMFHEANVKVRKFEKD